MELRKKIFIRDDKKKKIISNIQEKGVKKERYIFDELWLLSYKYPILSLGYFIVIFMEFSFLMIPASFYFQDNTDNLEYFSVFVLFIMISSFLSCTLLILKRIILNIILTKKEFTYIKFSTIFQSLIMLIFIFAIIIFFLQFYSKSTAYDGLGNFKTNTLGTPVFIDFFGSSNILKIFLNSIYFSAVTVTTLGYGDIKPHSMIAKMVSILEVVIGFSVITVALSKINSDSNMKNKNIYLNEYYLKYKFSKCTKTLIYFICIILSFLFMSGGAI